MLSALSGGLTFVLIAIVALVLGYGFANKIAREPGPLPADKIVFIPPHTDFPDILDQLETEGVTDNTLMLNALLTMEGNRSKVRAGEYLFKANVSMREVMDILVAGKQVAHKITIPEGLTSEQIVQRLKDDTELEGDVKDVPKEGSLLPETYSFVRGTQRGEILRQMQEAEKKATVQIWAKHDPNLPILKTPYEMVTLASIVEKETGKADERPHVASVFLNRLDKRMRLQSDPTIVYGIVGGKGSLGRGITRAEIDQPTAYNTYAIDGLPPGPICNPGKAAMEAVANPSRSKDLYFVADGTGGHVFAETLDQHVKNVQHWRQIEKDVKDRALPDADKFMTPPVPGQRTELEHDLTAPNGNVTAYAAQRADPVAQNDAQAAIAHAAPVAALPMTAQATVPPSAQKGKSTKSAAPPQNFSIGPRIEDLNLNIRGATDQDEDADAAKPQPALAAQTADPPPPFPISPERLAEIRARAAQYGLTTPPPQNVLQLNPQRSAQPAGTAQAAQFGSSKYKVTDVSEGTPLDPLLNKGYDLTTAKTVPPLH
ncbi:endolytic transglycosylase MltG [Methylovirgula sp. 4M-Z18]|nr:endolytic transglycosylase MltG [Methylovirgula sp. 4M-Z18]